MAAEKFPLEVTIKAVDEITGPLRAMTAKLRAFTAPLAKMSTGLKMLGKESGLAGLGKSFSAAGSSISSFASTAGMAVAGLLAGGYGLYSLVNAAVETGDKLGEMAQRTGLGVDAFASLQFAAGQADIEQEAFNASLDFFNKGVGQAKAGTGKLLAFLKKVSPTLGKQIKGAKTTEEALSLMTSAFEKVEDPAKRAALAQAAFANPQFGQFLGQGAAEIQKLQTEYLRLTGSQAKFAGNAGDLDNAMKKVGVAFNGFRVAAIAPLMPALTQLSVAATEFIVKNRDGIQKWAEGAGTAIAAWVEGGGLERLATAIANLARQGGELIDKLGGLEGAAKAVAVVLATPVVSSAASATLALATMGKEIVKVAWSIASLAFGPVIAAIGNFVIAIRAGYGAMAAFNLVLTANPIGVVIMAIAALAAAAYLIWDNWEPIKGFFIDLWDSISSGLKTAWDKMKPIIDKIGSALKYSPIGMLINGGKWIADKAWGTSSPAQSLGAAAQAARPAAPMSTTADVNVTFSNAPPGTRVSTAPQSTAPVSLDVGYSHAESM